MEWTKADWDDLVDEHAQTVWDVIQSYALSEEEARTVSAHVWLGLAAQNSVIWEGDVEQWLCNRAEKLAAEQQRRGGPGARGSSN